MGNVRWKANEVEFLKENYGVLKLEEIANAVNKTVLAVKRKVERDGIKSAKKWTDEEIE